MKVEERECVISETDPNVTVSSFWLMKCRLLETETFSVSKTILLYILSMFVSSQLEPVDKEYVRKCKLHKCLKNLHKFPLEQVLKYCATVSRFQY